MEEQLITLETAKLANKAGFKNITDKFYLPSTIHQDRIMLKYNEQVLPNGGYDAPTQSLLQRWLREVHDIDAEASLVERLNTRNYLIRLYRNSKPVVLATFHYYKTYEEALEEGLYQALKLIK